MHPFSDGDTHATFRNLQDETLREIAGLENDYVLKASASELEQYYVDKATVSPLVLHVDDYYIKSQSASQVDVSHDFSRVRSRDGRRVTVPGTVVKIAIPFEGDPALWRIRPSTFSLSGYPQIDLRPGEVILSFEFPDDAASATSLRSEIDRAVKSLADAADYVSRDVASHNASVASAVNSAIEVKRSKALAATSAVAALGIPMKRATTPTYTVPATRRPSPTRRPAVTTQAFEPEPTLDMAEYDFILSVLRNMSLVIERNPASFGALDEEAIRDHFLLQLNGQYEGTATGETFNSAGKTDILIRSGDRNVFIAECKFWRGARHFDKAIHQLLGYLTWRDSKTALLVFNRNRDSSAVRDKMHEVIVARPEYRNTVDPQSTCDRRYVLVKESEPGRELLLSTQIYDVPVAPGRE